MPLHIRNPWYLQHDPISARPFSVVWFSLLSLGLDSVSDVCFAFVFFLVCCSFTVDVVMSLLKTTTSSIWCRSPGSYRGSTADEESP